MSESVILTESEIQRSLKRIAHEIIEQTADYGHLILIGLRTRGLPLAERIASDMRSIKGETLPVGALDFTLYRDDLEVASDDMTVEPTDIPSRITGKQVVLVDDVLCTGRSVRAAIDALIDWGRPQSVQLAVLVDRGHREMPIKANFVGKNIPSSPHERVQVRLVEVDGRDEVVIIREEAALAAGGNGQ